MDGARARRQASPVPSGRARCFSDLAAGAALTSILEPDDALGKMEAPLPCPVRRCDKQLARLGAG